MQPSYITLSQTSGPVQGPRSTSSANNTKHIQNLSPTSLPENQQSTNQVMENTSVLTLEIKERQVSHFRRVIEILNRFYFYIDGSEMRTGKTYIAGGVALHLKLPVLVFCPNRVRSVWSNFLLKYGIPGYNLPESGYVMSYECLRSRKGYQPKHGLLQRYDGTDGVQFQPTELLVQLLQAGVFIIFDECQKLKNTSDQYKAAKSLMSQVYAIGGRSRVGFLSGTAMCKQDHAINFLRMVRFIEAKNLYSKVHGQIRLEGVNDLHNWARVVNPTATEQFISTHQFKSTKVGSIEYVFDLFAEVIKPGVMSIMPSLETPKDIKNGYYALDKNDEQEYAKAISNLAGAVRYNPQYGTVDMKDNMGAITVALERIQVAKYKMVARLVRQDLITRIYKDGVEYYPKVIVFCDYYKAIEPLMKELAEFNPVEFTGNVTDVNGQTNLAAFTEQSLRCRLLIGNPLVGGLGVSMRVPGGLFPIRMYIMPGYRVMDLHQAAHRPYPDDGPIISTVRFVYGLSGNFENSILSACARKGEVMKKLHTEQGAKFPNEYDSVYELEPDQVDDKKPTTTDRNVESIVDQALRSMKNTCLYSIEN